jgi:hypothetical protein
MAVPVDLSRPYMGRVAILPKKLHLSAPILSGLAK